MSLDTFDYGADLSEAHTHIKVWPTEGNRTALVDADLIPYKICFAIDSLFELKARSRVEDGEVSSLKETPEFTELCERMCSIYNGWVIAAGCDSAIPYLTASDNNFRLDIAFSRPYKGQRKKEKPPFFYELKEFFITSLGGVLSDGEEADDLISIEANRRNSILEKQGVVLGSPSHKEFCDFVICSSDKDLRIPSGHHYDPYCNRLSFGTPIGELEPVWEGSKIKKIKGSGLRFFYAQLLTGDSIDNYTGIPRYRLADVYSELSQLNTEKELYTSVLNSYKRKYGEGIDVLNYRGTKKYFQAYVDDFGKPPPAFKEWEGRSARVTAYGLMLEQGRLAHMQRFKGDIWRGDGKSTCPLGGDINLWSK